MLLAALVVVLLSRGSQHPAHAGPAPRRAAAGSAPRPAAPTPPRASSAASAPAPPVVAPLELRNLREGSLPPTVARPSASTPLFRSLMAALWAGVVAGSVRPALPAFFPKGAYEQLKAIAGAGEDWSARLEHDYALDLLAAHRLLGAGARAARLLRVEADPGFAHWVPAGVCDNAIGYYEMPGARVVYSAGGETRSFGIASMISWRGVWYVVHLGAVLRPGAEGVVDNPGRGAGAPEFSGTC